MYFIAVARHALTQRSKGQGHAVMKAVNVAQLLVTMAHIPHPDMPMCYLRLLLTWQPMFS